MRLFLYNYSIEENWPITQRREVFGVSHDGTGMDVRAERDLQVGDVVIIRDSSFPWRDCRVYGTCVITSNLIWQRGDESPWEDLLWFDEQQKRRVIYPMRWRVDFASAPSVGRLRIPWNEFDRIKAIGSRGQIIRGRNAWEKKFRGNLISSPMEICAINALLSLRQPSESSLMPNG